MLSQRVVLVTRKAKTESSSHLVVLAGSEQYVQWSGWSHHSLAVLTIWKHMSGANSYRLRLGAWFQVMMSRHGGSVVNSWLQCSRGTTGVAAIKVTTILEPWTRQSRRESHYVGNFDWGRTSSRILVQGKDRLNRVS